MSAEPFELLLAKMRAGDFQAAEQIFVTYEAQLRVIVRRQLSQRLRAKFDSLDVVQSVWTRVLHDFQAKGCHLTSPAHLRNFLVQVTRNCLIDRLRHYRVALEREQPAAGAAAAEMPARRQPRPSEWAQANELWENMLANAAPEHHELLRLKRQGFPLATIADRTGLHPDSVRRILRKLARKLSVPAEESNPRKQD